MDVWVKGKGKVTLSQGDFVAQGGQGAVYAVGGLAYKIYADPSGMISPAKIQELSALTLPAIIRPQDVLLDSKNTPVGYTMTRVKDAVALCQAFTRAWRDRNNVTPNAMLALVRKLQEGVKYIHEQGMLLVDLHEMNFLVNDKRDDILFIDVDSYQTPGFPATALMDSVRDRHSPPNRFSEDTDWFSFGIVSFQMFVGIHPYKGRHPTIADLDARMRQNISVFSRDVTVPKVCYPFDVIPQAYLNWYRAVFAQGMRCAPPFDLNAPLVLTPTVQRVTGSGKLLISMLGAFDGEIILPLPNAGPLSGVTTKGLFLRGKHVLPDPAVRVISTPRLDILIAVSLKDGRARFFDAAQGCQLAGEIEADALMTYQGRLYVKKDAALYEVEWLEFSKGPQPALRIAANVLPNATQVYEGVIAQNLLGAQYVSVFPGSGVCHSLRIKELDGYRIVDARFDNNVLMIVGVKSGRYDRLVLRFDGAYQTYDVRVAPDVAYTGLNFVTLDNGVCVHLNENEELEIFANRKDSAGLKVLSDTVMQSARLFKNGTQVLFSRGDALYSMTLKPH